jgi:hypothetical protein
MKKATDMDWDAVLSAAARLQGHIPKAVLVGGTASAIYASHRFSEDADHVLPNLRDEFDSILANLESVAGWKLARVVKPVLILGSLDGVDTGIRQLMRDAPLETREVFIKGQKIVVPTEEEILRIKGALILKRNAVRDYVDFAALSQFLGEEATAQAFERFDALYPQDNSQSPVQQLCLQLSEPKPFDLGESDLAVYKHLADRWKDWEAVKEQCIQASSVIFNSFVLGEMETDDSNSGLRP